MSESILVAWSEALLEYDMGVTHPMAPGRLEFTMALARDLDVVVRPGVTVEAPNPAPDDVLQLVHDPAYVAAVRDAAERHPVLLAEFGVGGQDNPVFERMHEACALVAGGTLDAARAVRAREAEHGVNIAGGLHHAMPDRASGFCVYNDCAVAISWLLDHGVRPGGLRRRGRPPRRRGAGGVLRRPAGAHDQPARDPLRLARHRVAARVRRGGAEGTRRQCRAAAGHRRPGWLRAFHAVVPSLLAPFQPEILVTQCGATPRLKTRWRTST